jgi:riboflavin kinase/FMN adenylyltransferase
MIVVLGSFDGFHRGHQVLLSKARNIATARGEDWGVLTFSPHPQSFFAPDKSKLLFTESEKEVISRFLDIPEMIRLPFDKELSERRPEAFLDHIAHRFDISGIVVGDNFRFGRGRTGNIEFLQHYCGRNGISFIHIPTLSTDHTTISSTMIRGLISCGEVVEAAKLLGYNFFIMGKVVQGDKRGRKLGYPTANLSRTTDKVIPAEGVYSAAVFIQDKWWASAVNIGSNPTFGDLSSVRIEAHLMDFIGNIYDENLSIVFLERIRGELSFATPADLRYQITEDTRIARSIYERKYTEDRNFFSRFSEATS